MTKIEFRVLRACGFPSRWGPSTLSSLPGSSGSHAKASKRSQQYKLISIEYFAFNSEHKWVGSYNVDYEIIVLTKLDSWGSSVEVVLPKLHNNVDEEMEISDHCQLTIISATYWWVTNPFIEKSELRNWGLEGEILMTNKIASNY